jgi:hypothetical protein
MTQRDRWLAVIAAAGVVAAAAIALLIANRGSAKAHAADGSSASASGVPAAPAAGDPGPAPTAPSLASGSAAPAAPDTVDRPDVTTVDDHGGVTHDHRDLAGDFHRPPPDHVPWHKPVRVTGKFAGDVGRLITPIAQACATQIPADARGAQPVMQVQLVVSVKGGQLSVDDVQTSFRDVSGDQGSVQDCVRSKAGAITLDASTQPDVDHYPITMPMRIAS